MFNQREMESVNDYFILVFFLYLFFVLVIFVKNICFLGGKNVSHEILSCPLHKRFNSKSINNCSFAHKGAYEENFGVDSRKCKLSIHFSLFFFI